MIDKIMNVKMPASAGTDLGGSDTRKFRRRRDKVMVQ